MKTGEWIRRILVIIIGSAVCAYGITQALYAGFGGATLAVLWQGVSLTFGISVGTASFILAVIMLVFVFFYDRRQIHVGTILYQTIYSFCVDLFADAHVYSDRLWINFVIMVLGVVIFSFGAGLYASADLGRGAYEALTFALAGRNGWQVRYVRMGLDVFMVIAGVLLGGTFGLCTVVTVLISGPVIQFTMRMIEKLTRRPA